MFIGDLCPPTMLGWFHMTLWQIERSTVSALSHQSRKKYNPSSIHSFKKSHSMHSSENMFCLMNASFECSVECLHNRSLPLANILNFPAHSTLQDNQRRASATAAKLWVSPCTFAAAPKSVH